MVKLVGMILVVAASSAVGFGFAANIRAQSRQIEALLSALSYMKNEIAYRLTPLPELFYLLGKSAARPVGAFFAACAEALMQNPSASVQGVVRSALSQTPQLAITQQTRQTLLELALSLGKFDANGAGAALELAESRLRQELMVLDSHKRERCRSYETIGVCAGLALAVILL